MITNWLLKNISNLTIKNNFDISLNKLFGVIITKKYFKKQYYYCNDYSIQALPFQIVNHPLQDALIADFTVICTLLQKLMMNMKFWVIFTRKRLTFLFSAPSALATAKATTIPEPSLSTPGTRSWKNELESNCK